MTLKPLFYVGRSLPRHSPMIGISMGVQKPIHYEKLQKALSRKLKLLKPGLLITLTNMDIPRDVIRDIGERTEGGDA